MRFELKIIALIGLTIFITGCSVAMPRHINGKYYMGGDSNCRGYRELSNSRIMCLNKAGKDTGYRDAMTDYELQMYSQRQQTQKPTYTNCYSNYAGGVYCTSY